jgi:predicted transcriptional regulator
MLCRDRDLQAIMAEKQQVAGTIDAKINNVIYMELYTGAKLVDDKYEKTNIAGSIDREFTV